MYICIYIERECVSVFVCVIWPLPSAPCPFLLPRHTHVYTLMYISIHIFTFIHKCIAHYEKYYMYVCICTYAYIYIYLYLRVNICIYTGVYTYTCVNMYSMFEYAI